MDHASTTGDKKLDQIVDALEEKLSAPAATVREFAKLLLLRGSVEFLEGRPLAEAVEEIAALYRLADETPSGEIGTALLVTPDQPNRAVLHTVMTDRPFIVDTLREYVHSLGLAIPHLLHPVFVFERDADGHIVDARGRSAGSLLTSVVHITMEGPLADEKRGRIEREVKDRLADVEAVTTDFPRLLERTSSIIDELDEMKSAIPWRASEVEEVQELLKWLEDPGFVFLGYRAYAITPDATGSDKIGLERGSGLGILRNEEESRYWEPLPVEELSADLKARLLGGPLLIVSKTNAESPVRRRARMDYIGIKRLAPDGTVRGEHRFLGLFTARAYSQDASTIPILRRKLREILQRDQAVKGSHDYNLILETFNSMPKEELFLESVDELRAVIDTVMETEGADDVRVTTRPDVLGRGTHVVVIMPKQRFSGEVRRKLQEVLIETYRGTLLNYHLALGQGDQARLHFYLGLDPDAATDVDVLELENVVRGKVRTWEERLEDALVKAHGRRDAHELAVQYRACFSDEYQAAVDVGTAVSDIRHLEELGSTGVQQAALEPVDPERPNVSRLKIFAPRGMFVLSDVMPMLENLGFRVVEAYRYEVGREVTSAATIHIFYVEVTGEWPFDRVESESRVADTLRAVQSGEAENDRLNSLVLSARLTWPQVSVLRAYAGYAFRIGAVGSRLGAVLPLTLYPECARLLLEAFEVRMDPGLDGEREAVGRRARDRLTTALASVRGIEHDRTLRRLLDLIEATLRTNYFRDSFRKLAVPLTLKFDCQSIEFMPDPRPKYEVYLRGPHTEAAHLRMGDVARGGIRWSDRIEDFRVEVLGLVKTQRVKNAVIVPAGAKGAFISKRSASSREETLAGGIESYKQFIRGLLDITDNVVGDEVIHPPDVVIHDGKDPYLVVAADKGTATLSDTANALGREAGFWLGDAFASGGAQGYDHKAEAITARGAWECVRRHFRERDLDIEREPFTVVGIGDMSGDVFGNGMLLSRRIRLVAAFDHRHVFLDPDPDPETSWKERERLFRLPTSSWEDYDRRLISEGGGVFERAEKEIHLSPQARARLGVEEEVLNGDEIIQAILRAPADLLWNGGIGTYVKATTETHPDVRDPGNDRVRVDAPEVRARVIGEGGNLGLTQSARVECALGGCRLNTDALDNSGGVDMSDREVNLKILLDAALERGTLDPERRNAILRECTDAVSEAVLANNHAQSLAVSLDERRAEADPTEFLDTMLRLEREGLLDLGLESLPAPDDLAERQAAGGHLTRPELAVLLAFAKLHLKQWLLSSEIPEDPAMLDLVRSYFPQRALSLTGEEELRSHRLRAHIASTVLTNRFVDRMGATAHIRLMGETGQSAAMIARTWYIANRVVDADALYEDLRDSDSAVRAGAQCQWYLEMGEALERATRWLFEFGDLGHAIDDAIDWYRGPVRALRASLPGLLTGERLEAFRSRIALYEMDGLSTETAGQLSTFLFLDELLPIARLIRQTSMPAEQVGAVYLGIAEDIDFPWLRGRLDAHAGRDIWKQRAARILNGRLVAARSRISARILRDAGESSRIEDGLERFRKRHGNALQRIRNVVEDVRSSGAPDLAALIVAVDAVDDPDFAATALEPENGH